MCETTQAKSHTDKKIFHLHVAQSQFYLVRPTEVKIYEQQLYNWLLSPRSTQRQQHQECGLGWGQQGRVSPATDQHKQRPWRGRQNQVPVLWRHCVYSLAGEWDFFLLLNISSSVEHNPPANKTFACFVSFFCPQHISQHVTAFNRYIIARTE